MRSQNISLRNSDGQHQRWICKEEADRLEKDGQAVRSSPRKSPQLTYQLLSFPDASESQNTFPALTRTDSMLLASLPAGYLQRLRSEQVREMPKARLQGLQRLMGWGLIPHVKLLADAGDS